MAHGRGKGGATLRVHARGWVPCGVPKRVGRVGLGRGTSLYRCTLECAANIGDRSERGDVIPTYTLGKTSASSAPHKPWMRGARSQSDHQGVDGRRGSSAAGRPVSTRSDPSSGTIADGSSPATATNGPGGSGSDGRGQRYIVSGVQQTKVGRARRRPTRSRSRRSRGPSVIIKAQGSRGKRMAVGHFPFPLASWRFCSPSLYALAPGGFSLRLGQLCMHCRFGEPEPHVAKPRNRLGCTL